jgi:hypothetical protein
VSRYETASPIAPSHRLVCSWCDAEIAPGIEPISHGICKCCADAEIKKLAAQKGRAA